MAIDPGYVDRFDAVAYKYYLAKAIASLVLSSEETDEYLAALDDSLDGVRTELQEYYGALAATVEGIHDADAEATANGLRRVLADHEGDIQGDPDTNSELICIEATALMTLARQCGVDVDLDSEFVPAEFVE